MSPVRRTVRARRGPGRLTGMLLSVLALVLLAVPALAGPPVVTPIPGPLDGPLPRFSGAAVTANPLRGPWRPANPALAPDGRSGSGLAAGNGAASPLPGPLGVRTDRASALLGGTCSSLAFDARDRLLAVCGSQLGPVLRLVDPATLATIASLTLPRPPLAERSGVGGGAHFLVRADGSVLVPTNANTLLHLAVDAGGFRTLGTTGLGGLLKPAERLVAVAAGYDGRDWVTGSKGAVIAVPRGGGTPKALMLGESIAEDLATDPDGTFVVTREALYRLVARADGTPRVAWRLPLAVGTVDARSGRLHQGSGTAPAIVAGGFVAVADGANPPRLVVARTGGRDARRLACSVPLFRPGQGSVEAGLVVAGRSVVVANAYGYNGPATTEGGGTTTGGITRVIVGRRGCRTAWASPLVSPSASAVVSRVSGLLYTVLKPKGAPDAWNLAALDWRTGALRFQVLAGEGLGFNSDGGSVVLGPDGAAFAGSFGGVSRFRDR